MYYEITIGNKKILKKGEATTYEAYAIANRLQYDALQEGKEAQNLFVITDTKIMYVPVEKDYLLGQFYDSVMEEEKTTKETQKCSNIPYDGKMLTKLIKKEAQQRFPNIKFGATTSKGRTYSHCTCLVCDKESEEIQKFRIEMMKKYDMIVLS